ncbi:MAG: hypothetical protein WCI92_05255 [Bacteroidota bacterium]
MKNLNNNSEIEVSTVKLLAPVLKNNFPGYPAYPVQEDIYSSYHEMKDLDPEDISKTKEHNGNIKLNRIKNFNEDISGYELDVPGSEMDDKMEEIGSEDEENNYYSIGGYGQANLDEINSIR